MKISVIIPVYNVAEWLDECIDSVLSQTFSDLELILVDDGSTDASPAICDKRAECDGRVRVFHNANGGANAARRYGVERAQGEFVYFLDSDDTIDPDTLEKGLELAGEGIDIVSMEEDEDLVCSAAVFGSRLLNWKAVNLVSKIYRRSLFDSPDVFDFPRGFPVAEDLIANVRLLRHIKGDVAVCSLHKYHYRPVRTSLTHSFKVTPEFDIRVMGEVTKAVAATPLDLEDAFVSFRISILKHLVCAGYPFDREWAEDLERDSRGKKLDSLQRLVVASIDRPALRPLVKLMVIWRKALRRLKLG